MEDPKVKPKLCQKGGCENTVAKGRYCPNCQLKDLYAAKRQRPGMSFSKKKKTPLDRAISKAERGAETAEKLYKKALVLWSDVVRPESDTCSCQTCGDPLVTRGRGFWGAHAGHFLDKYNHWKLSLDYVNGIEQCKKCNCDYIHHPGKIELMKVKMRVAMVARHGKDAIEDLEARGEKFRLDVKQGKENSKPRTHDPMAAIYGRESDIDFIKRKITELKRIKEKNKNI